MTIKLPYQDKTSNWSSHTRIIERLSILPAGSRILDVGTASGMLARMCQNKSLDFYGVEPNTNWAEIAAPFYKTIWIQSIDSLDEKFSKGYQVVILGDMLEHLSNPEVVLQKLAGLQSPGSIFLISVPNVANLWVRLNLLFGKFDYTERGILDRTHLRFFTRKSLTEMINHSGLVINSILVTPIPLELISPFFVSPLGRIIHAAFAWITSIFPTLLGYQFFVEARKP